MCKNVKLDDNGLKKSLWNPAFIVLLVFQGLTYL